jgi:hypothetical protein
MILYIILSIIIILLLVAFVTKKEHFSLEHDITFLNNLKNENNTQRELRKQENIRAYSETQQKSIDAIETEVNKFDEILNNIKSSLNNKSIPICREIDLNHALVDSTDPCTNRDIGVCALNSFCIVDKDTVTNEKQCRKKTLNPACRDIIQTVQEDLPNGTRTDVKKITKLFFYPRVMDELQSLRSI